LGLDGGDLVKKLVDHPDGFAATAGTFHFSMLGFLAAFLAITVAIAQTKAFKSYSKNGHLTVQLWLVSLTMIELVVGFVLAMMMLTILVGPVLVSWNIYAIAVCLVMIVISLCPIVFMLLQVASTNEDKE
jgi:hypothetical protein